jgi:hypothetical protein
MKISMQSLILVLQKKSAGSNILHPAEKAIPKNKLF